MDLAGRAKKVALSCMVVCGVLLLLGALAFGVGVSVLGVNGLKAFMGSFFLESITIVVYGVILLLTAGIMFIGLKCGISRWKADLKELESKQDELKDSYEDKAFKLKKKQIEKRRRRESTARYLTKLKEIGDLVPVETPKRTPSPQPVEGFSYLKSAYGWEDIGEEEKKLYLDPLNVARVIAEEQNLWLSLTGTELFYRKDIGKAIRNRCSRELFYVSLGFLSLKELQEIDALYERCPTDSDYRELYADCIKKYPQLVAAEAAFFMWIKESFPYLALAKDAVFRDADGYRKKFFSYRHAFLNPFFSKKEEKVRHWLEKFTGWGPVCLASIQVRYRDQERLSDCDRRLNWDSFCRSIPAFYRQAIFREGVSGRWECFLEFMDKGDQSSWLATQEEALDIPKEETNFFVSPKSLWDMKDLCANDAELAAKIEEGLAALHQAGYLGEWSVEEIQNFERGILGLKELEDERKE